MKKVSETKLNRFLDVVEEKYLGKNPIKRWISKYKFNKFCRETMKSSPSIGILWYFAEFIKLSERVYFYPNNKDSVLYSSRNYAVGENGFCINDSDNKVKILVKLISDTQGVKVQITRNASNYTTEHKFVENEWTDDRADYDEVLIDNIIGIINSHIVALLKWCWEKKGNYDRFDKTII